MWSYYGSKSKIIDLYPRPNKDKIIEPFAGSARYALKYFDKEVTIVDKYETVIKIWKWLQQCSENDILSLPKFKGGESIKGIKWDCEAQGLFMGYMVGRGLATPQYKVSPFVASEKQYHFEFTYKRIASELFKIKHWDIILGSYDDLENNNATWFIDPPYQFGGKYYKERNIDFNNLSEWCKSRNGQVIVCENTKATWLPFNPLSQIQGCLHKTTEAIWTNEPTHYDNIQQSLF